MTETNCPCPGWAVGLSERDLTINTAATTHATVVTTAAAKASRRRATGRRTSLGRVASSSISMVAHCVRKLRNSGSVST